MAEESSTFKRTIKPAKKSSQPKEASEKLSLGETLLKKALEEYGIAEKWRDFSWVKRNLFVLVKEAQKREVILKLIKNLEEDAKPKETPKEAADAIPSWMKHVKEFDEDGNKV